MKQPRELVVQDDVARFGLWLYLLSDAMIFGTLFATFMILRHNTAGGPDGAALFEAPYVLLQTMALLTSSFTMAMALAAMRAGKSGAMMRYLLATAVLGGTFLLLEIVEFARILHEGFSWQTSAFLSSFFALVGTHGLHIVVGLLWLAVFMYYLRQRGINAHMTRKLGLFGLFWHFLDIVWIFIFTIVYMFGIGAP